jgi:hypothetical protein
VVSVLATGPTGCSVAGSNPTKDGGGEVSRQSHVVDSRHVKEPYRA